MRLSRLSFYLDTIEICDYYNYKFGVLGDPESEFIHVASKYNILHTLDSRNQIVLF